VTVIQRRTVTRRIPPPNSSSSVEVSAIFWDGNFDDIPVCTEGGSSTFYHLYVWTRVYHAGAYDVTSGHVVGTHPGRRVCLSDDLPKHRNTGNNRDDTDRSVYACACSFHQSCVNVGVFSFIFFSFYQRKTTLRRE